MKESEIIKCIIETVINAEGAEMFEALQWLFKEYDIAVTMEKRRNV